MPKLKRKHHKTRHYFHDFNYHLHQKKWRRTKRRTFIVVGLIVILLIIVLADSLLQLIQSAKPSRPTAETSQSYTIPFQTFRTEFFEFQTGKQWQAVTKESTASKYVYRAFNSTFVEHEITIYVNDKSTASVEATRVIPVSIQNGKIIASTASNHCKEGFPKIPSHFPIPITYDGVTFTCNPDSNNYVAIIGKTGGNTEITLKRPSGASITYGFVYRALQSAPDDGQARKILQSFKPL
jgi:hypothetical protein